MQHWKTTVSAICSFLMVLGLYLTGYLAQQPTHASWEPKTTAITTFAVGALKVVIGFLQKDA